MNSGQYPERVASKCNHAGKRPTRLCIESRSYKIFLSHESKVKCNTESKAASPKYLLLLLLHLKTTENSRIWKYDTRRALRIGLQLCINKQQPRVVKKRLRAHLSQPWGLPQKAHRVQDHLVTEEPKNQNVPKKLE